VNTVLRIVGALLLLAIMAFCIFGFMATFEPSDQPRLPWQIGYAFVSIICLARAIMLMLPKKQNRSEKKQNPATKN